MNDAREKPYAAAGALLQGIRRERRWTAEAMARRLGVPAGTMRTYLAGWSAPRRHDPLLAKMRSVLGEEFSEQYVLATELGRGNDVSPKIDEPLARAERMLAKGRLTEARAIVDAAPSRPTADAAKLYINLGRVFVDRNRIADGVDCYMQACAYYRHTGDAKAVEEIFDEIGARLMAIREYPTAVDILSNELRARPNSPKIWRRLGIVHWYADELIEAYAALSTALSCGMSPLTKVFHARGQVLAEMGNYREAYEELTKVLEAPLTANSLSFARSTRAFALFFLGEKERAKAEFEVAAKVTPHNAWLYWFWARCAEEDSAMGDPRELYARSLREEVPPLTPSKRSYAEARVATYNGE